MVRFTDVLARAGWGGRAPTAMLLLAFLAFPRTVGNAQDPAGPIGSPNQAGTEQSFQLTYFGEYAGEESFQLREDPEIGTLLVTAQVKVTLAGRDFALTQQLRVRRGGYTLERYELAALVGRESQSLRAVRQGDSVIVVAEAPGGSFRRAFFEPGEVFVLDNLLANHTFYGVRLFSTPVSTQVLRNTFRNCGAAVVLRENARCVLGNLNNTSTGDDGGNNFRPSNTWHIRNETPNVVKAEGNRFATTSRSEINAKIWDKRDQPGLGRVDFDPLMGGVSPTGTVLAVTGLAAAPTTAGAQITFALSSAAQVQARILNIAGRPVKTLCRAKDCEAGTNTLLWNAQSDNGLQAPNGMYLVEVMAKAGDGGQVRALGQVSVSK